MGEEVAGFVALAGGLFSLLRGRWWFGAAGLAVAAAAAIICLRPFMVEAYPTSYFHSPVRYGVVSIARGQPLYAENCAVCHGPNGYGDGPAAAALPIKPADLTGAHLFHHGEGTLFWWVSHGIAGTPMPGFADQLGETERWDVLNFLRAQADAEQSSAMGDQVEPFLGVVAPDFAFQIDGEPQETLRGERGNAIVLLVLYSMPKSSDRLRQLEAARPMFDKAGARVIALPINPAAPAPAAAAILAAPSAETIAAYALFRHDPVAGVPPVPKHMEFLIDRAGYLRARWIPNEEPGWGDIAILLSEIDHLNREPSRPPAPQGHVH
jgi:putative copper resistance protein D